MDSNTGISSIGNSVKYPNNIPPYMWEQILSNQKRNQQKPFESLNQFLTILAKDIVNSEIQKRVEIEKLRKKNE